MSDKIDKNKKLKLPSLLSDGMVLQRKEEIEIWGWAAAYQKVKVNFKGEEYLTKANSEGKWSINLPPQQAGGPFAMEITAAEDKIVVEDILIGEVWLCSGQSNMELSMERVKDRYPEEIKKAQNNQIREFKIPISYNFNQENKDINNASWKSVKKDNILDFSALVYFFAKNLYQKFEVPVAVVNASVGGSPVEAWMSQKSLKDYPGYLRQVERFKDQEYIKKIEKENFKINKNWYQNAYRKDKGINKNSLSYYQPEYDDSKWKEVEIPLNFKSINFADNGIIWFRKTINLTQKQSSQNAKLWLGTIVDADKVYINGKKIGETTYKYPPRKYEIAAGLLNKGENLITIRVIVTNGPGEFVKDKDYKLIFADEEIDLKNNWKYNFGTKIKEAKKNETFIQWQPTGLYNAMIAPILDYRFKGICWYQGESNTGREEEYRDLFTKMIQLWRNRFSQKEIAFIFAQLPNFEPPEANKRDSWAAFRAAQREALKLENTAMTVNLDLGEWNDLHPLNKKDVAYRFYLAALNLAYGKKVNYKEPKIIEKNIKGDKIILEFDNLDTSLNDSSFNSAFELAASNQDFKKVEAKIKDNRVIIINNKINSPRYLRYAWQDNPDQLLYNKVGIPAGTFKIKL